MAKVFISYRHETGAEHPNHQQLVANLGSQLRDANLEVVLDQFYKEQNPGGPDEGWPKWCEDQATKAEKIIIVASTGYFQCYEQTEPPASGLGAACEINVIRNSLYQNGYKSNKLRIVHFNSAHIMKSVPMPLFQINYFDVTDVTQVCELALWAGGKIENTEKGGTPIAPAIHWPPPVEGYVPSLANRCDEFGFFTSMVAGRSKERGLFFHAPSDHGKTTLLGECRKYARKALSNEACITVDFKVNPSREGMINLLEEGLRNRSSTSVKAAKGELRTGLRSISQPSILFFDSYELASPDARDFLAIVLSELEAAPAIRIVIAGKKIPNYKKALWSEMIRSFELGAITDSGHWIRYAQIHYPNLQPHQIQTLTDATGGNPGNLNTLIASLALKCGP